MALSVDLRKRVIEAVDNDMRISEAAIIFKISRRVIYNWIDLREETNSLEPKTGYQKGHSHKITDWDLFRKFVEKYKHYTSSQMRVEWKKLTDIDMSESVMLRALKKIGYTAKKKHFTMLKQV